MSVLADLPRGARVGALLGVVSVLCGASGLAFGPLVRGSVKRAAERRGLRVEVGEVRLGAGAIWLRELDLCAPQMPGVKVHIDAARLGLGWYFNLAEVAVHGAKIELSGEADDLQRQYAAYRGARPKETSRD